MEVTLDGMVREPVKPLQPLNAPDSILVTLDGMVMEVSLQQPENEPFPIEVTLDGTVREPVKPLQPLNAS